MLSSTLFLAVLAAVVPSTIASFPGSSFGIAYNTTSTAIPTTGHLGTFQAEGSSPVFLTALVDGPNDLGGFFSVSGPNGFLNEACGVNGLATLIPANPIIGIKYALGWSKAPLSSLPTGSIQDGFQLGPAPTFDTIINTKLGEGSWAVIKDLNSGSFIVGWSDDADRLPITLVKTDPSNIQC